MYILTRISLAYFDGNRSHNLAWNKLECPYVEAYMSQISLKSVQRFDGGRTGD